MEAGDILGFVRLRRGEAEEAAHLLDAVVRTTRRLAHLGGRAHLHFAEALLRAGYPEDAWKALRTALVLEPTLGPEIQAVEAFAPWKESGRLERLFEEERERFLDRWERD